MLLPLFKLIRKGEKKGTKMAEEREIKTTEPIPKILIGVPILSWTHEFAESFLKFWTDLMTYSNKGRKFHVAYKFAYRRPVHMAEQEIVELAISSGCTHVLLMDDDIYDITADMLLKLLDADKDVIAGLMYTSGFPYSLCAFRRYNPETKVVDQPVLHGPARLYEIPPDQREGVQWCDLVPFCFTLIKTSVFSRIKKVDGMWFKCTVQAPTDSWFCDDIIELGIYPHVHFDVWLNHRGITRYNQPQWAQLGMANQQAQGGNQIINLTPEEMARHFAAMSLKLKEAEEKAKKRMADKLQFYERNETDPIGKLVEKPKEKEDES